MCLNFGDADKVYSPTHSLMGDDILNVLVQFHRRPCTPQSSFEYLPLGYIIFFVLP